MSENDIEMHVEILNLRYKLVGFTAIREFKEWLDANASSCHNGNGGCDYPDSVRAEPPSLLTTSVPEPCF